MSGPGDAVDRAVTDAVADERIGAEDAAQVLRFRDLLREIAERGRPAVMADPAWRPWLTGGDS